MLSCKKADSNLKITCQYEIKNKTTESSLRFLYGILFWDILQGLWDLGSQTKDQTHVPCTGSQIPIFVDHFILRPYISRDTQPKYCFLKSFDMILSFVWLCYQLNIQWGSIVSVCFQFLRFAFLFYFRFNFTFSKTSNIKTR